ncbi:hypothetical protein EON65_26110 [archaeon]|nr:MAG: hypothetical protein EON65_26110 [archaeon]
MENQINSLLAGQLDTFDNAELEKELAELMGESAPVPNKVAASQPVDNIALPDVPTHEIRVPAPAAVSAQEEADREERVLVNA